MIECKDFSTNQLSKIDTDIDKCPHQFFFYSNGMHLLFIKRLRDGRFGLCGLGTNMYPLEHQHDCDVYYKTTSLLECKKLFEKTISLLITPDIDPVAMELF